MGWASVCCFDVVWASSLVAYLSPSHILPWRLFWQAGRPYVNARHGTWHKKRNSTIGRFCWLYFWVRKHKLPRLSNLPKLYSWEEAERISQLAEPSPFPGWSLSTFSTFFTAEHGWGQGLVRTRTQSAAPLVHFSVTSKSRMLHEASCMVTSKGRWYFVRVSIYLEIREIFYNLITSQTDVMPFWKYIWKFEKDLPIICNVGTNGNLIKWKWVIKRLFKSDVRSCC